MSIQQIMTWGDSALGDFVEEQDTKGNSPHHVTNQQAEQERRTGVNGAVSHRTK